MKWYCTITFLLYCNLLITTSSVGKNKLVYDLAGALLVTPAESSTHYTSKRITLLADSAGGNQTLCEVDYTYLNASSESEGVWSTSSSANIVDPNDPKTLVTNLIPGNNYTFTWTAGGITADIEVEVRKQLATPSISAKTNTVVCEGTSVRLEAQGAPPGGSYKWFRNGKLSISSDDNWIYISSPTENDKYEVVAMYRDSVCESDRSDSLFVTIHAKPDKPTIDASDSIACEDSIIQLAADSQNEDVYQWSRNSIITNLQGPVIEIDQPHESGDYQLAVINSNGCVSDKSNVESILIQNKPSPAQAEDSILLCNQTSTSVTATAPQYGEGIWSVVSGPAQIQHSSDSSAFVSGLQENAQDTLSWTVSNGVCPHNVANLIITTRKTPNQVSVGDNLELCNETEVQLEATPPGEGQHGGWVKLSGTGTFNDTTLYNARISALMPGDNVELEWTIYNECGSSSDTLKIINEEQPEEADAGDDIQVCELSEVQLNASGGNGKWSVSNNTAVLDQPTQHITTLHSLPYETTIATWTVDTHICPSSSDSVNIIRDRTPKEFNAGADVLFCNGETSSRLDADEPDVGTGQWTVSFGSGIVIDTTSPTSEINNLSTGETILEWSVKNGVCVEKDSIKILVYQFPELASDNYTICEGETASLEVIGGDNYVWSPSESLSASDIAKPEASPELTTNYQVVVGNGECGSDTLLLLVNVNDKPEMEVSPDSTISLGMIIGLKASGAEFYHWQPEEGISFPDEARIEVNPQMSTLYTVIGTNELGCSAEASVMITVNERHEVFVPDLFSPNGDDINDYLKVNALGVSSLEFKVYNRQGKEVFSTNDADHGWDGRWKGATLMSDVYLYTVKATTVEGNTISKKGTVRLVR
ncbi:gliding motility-associated C-terminal domain-containing protein [Fulvivirga maritima]|uniref:T9SS type B sorting domain-containing protein n=1 Tax=Fulvivirga maritima TaxID=2904247 RepID=UPI001F23A902|nr:gliding motility-associated C-terminal domain-containing protein [Fulvivirga maritima]UII29146.1 gliding motility-associated C-terminal domain-containing protein [Fulvivirga maritima]